MKKYRLMEYHPDFQKFDKLCALAEELGICICSSGVLNLRVGDRKYSIQDIENVNSHLTEFPPSTEFFLTFEK